MFAGSLVAGQSLLADRIVAEQPALTGANAARGGRLDLNRHRFGVNYTPSQNWWFCWSDWNSDSIRRDLDAIAALGADHMRVQLLWPFFQPNPTWVSPAHLERLDQLLTLMGEHNLDALVTVFTGQLSGGLYLPPFGRTSGFYSDPATWDSQELFVRALARVMAPHRNIIGFDLGNEINTCWKAEPAVGDAWMGRMFALMQSVCPEGLHVNGVDQDPWFDSVTYSAPTSFSATALAANCFPVIHGYPYWSGALKYGGPMDPPSIKMLSAMAALIRSYAGTQQKPVWAGEFNTCIKELTEKQQAQWLEKAVLAAIGEGVSWFTYWSSHNVDRRFKFEELEYDLGLLTNDGQVKEQGYVFKELADSYRDKPVVFPTAALLPPPAYRNTDASWRWMLDWMGWTPKDGKR